MKQYKSPEMEMITFPTEEILAATGGLELPAVPLTLRNPFSGNEDLQDNGSYDIF